MSRSLSFVLAFVFCVITSASAFAVIGESEKDFRARYAKAFLLSEETEPGKVPAGGDASLCFETSIDGKKEMWVSAVFKNGKVVMEEYNFFAGGKVCAIDRAVMPRVEAVLAENSGGKKWEALRVPRTTHAWQSGDLSAMVKADDNRTLFVFGGQ